MKLQLEIEYANKQQGVEMLQRVSETLGFIPKFEILEHCPNTQRTKYTHLKLVKGGIAC